MKHYGHRGHHGHTGHTVHHEHHGRHFAKLEHRHHRATGGVNEAEMDLDTYPEERTNARNIDHEAEERRHGGRTKRKHGGHVHGHVTHKSHAHHGHMHHSPHGHHEDGFGPEHHGFHHKKRRHRRAGGGVETHEYDTHVEGKKHQDGEGFGLQNRGPKRKQPVTAKRRGGPAHHKAKDIGHVHGMDAHHHAGRKPRKRGGQAVAETNPFTTAAKGTPPKGRSLDMEMDGAGVHEI